MIAIVDYGMGNLRSVEKALQFLGFEAKRTADSGEVAAASHIILPGVGAFRDAMRALTDTGLIETMLQAVNSGTPFLGICLGMQMMFEKSYEDGQWQGLGLLPGEITLFEEKPGLKVPHMGWNSLHLSPCPLFKGLKEGASVYFVHSYHLPYRAGADYIAATTDYGGPFISAVQKGNLFGLQFHPEKSGQVGLQMLKNFGELKNAKNEEGAVYAS
ncbi:Imidazole glycerol phosphate synthase subunit HisH 1 [uncultured Clostridium sp.]|nr:Imidazole glycerol phosphate synthase subunit HisH 1 [uncultured Clostridium sp.]